MMSTAYDYSLETPASAFLARPQQQLLIDGRRVPSVSGQTFKSLNPATE
jgi:aldehyde dehydrogenase (NAD+)